MGKTGGRGGKGQTARSGVRIKGFEGGQMPLHRRLPKRGFKNVSFARRLNEVNLEKIQAAIEAGKLDVSATVDAAALVKAGVLRRSKDGVRLLGSGEIKTKVETAQTEQPFEKKGAKENLIQMPGKGGKGPVMPGTGPKKGPGKDKGVAPVLETTYVDYTDLNSPEQQRFFYRRYA